MTGSIKELHDSNGFHRESEISDISENAIKHSIRENLLREMDMSRDISDEELRVMIDAKLHELGDSQYISIRRRCRLQREIFNSLRGMCELSELIDDPEITEIMINGADTVFIERHGAIQKWDRCFESEQKLADIIQQIVVGTNRVINESNPIVDCRLPNGSRVNVVLPPVSLDGPVVTIRKFPERVMTMQALIELGSISTEAAEYLKRLVIAGYNIFVSGGTGSGKTTFLNALSSDIPPQERIITIEDAAELQLPSIPNLVRLEVRNANLEGNHAISIRDLIKSSLRMRPDRIVVGEVRDGSAIDMLQALNTGHSGMSTGHANSAQDMLSRIETMCLLGADIPLNAVRKQIASAIDIIVHLGRMRDRSRRVLEITEVLSCIDGEIELNPLFTFRESVDSTTEHVAGRLERTGQELIHRQKLISAGLSEYMRESRILEIPLRRERRA